MSIKAKTILKNKFWIVEQNGANVGTISLDDDRYLFSSSGRTEIFESLSSLQKGLGDDVIWASVTDTATKEQANEVQNFPTSCTPFNPIYDVTRKLPLFTKSEKSKSLYCAGYYIIRFDKGWVKSFCPKLITIERYPFKGPFKTQLEMRTELSKANGK